MAVNLAGGAPYAPFTSINEFLNRNRSGNLPTSVTPQALERMGITRSLRPRTMQALKLLDFITDDGQITDEIANLRRVPTPEYNPKLAEMLRSAYADVFAVVDPTGATYEQVSDAFRGFTPSGQMTRMVALFLSLLDSTGEWPNLPKSRLLSKPTASGKPVLRKKPTPGPGETTEALTAPTTPTRPSTGTGQEYSKTVELGGSAGTVTLSADVNPIKLKGAVRDFFYALVDQMDDYELAQAPVQNTEPARNAEQE